MSLPKPDDRQRDVMQKQDSDPGTLGSRVGPRVLRIYGSSSSATLGPFVSSKFQSRTITATVTAPDRCCSSFKGERIMSFVLNIYPNGGRGHSVLGVSNGSSKRDPPVEAGQRVSWRLPNHRQTRIDGGIPIEGVRSFGERSQGPTAHVFRRLEPHTLCTPAGALTFSDTSTMPETSLLPLQLFRSPVRLENLFRIWTWERTAGEPSLTTLERPPRIL